MSRGGWAAEAGSDVEAVVGGEGEGVDVVPERLTGTMIPAGARGCRIGVTSEAITASISARRVTACLSLRTPGDARASRP